MTQKIKKLKRRIDFRDQIARNKRNSILFLILIFLILMALGWVIGKIFRADIFIFMIIFSIFSILYLWLTYYNSAKIALLAVGARKADPTTHKRLYDIVEGLSIAAGLPMPKIYIMNQEAINAFATGKDPSNAVVCVTRGALKKLNKDELEGVIAHELSHIKNYDIRFVTIVSVVVGLVDIVAQLFIRSLWYRDISDDNKNAGVLILIGIILAIIAPIAVRLVQLAISRRREFMADAGAVEITRYPPGLINALEKIKKDTTKMKVSAAVAPMFFSDPLKKRLMAIFETHPPIDERIRILKMM